MRAGLSLGMALAFVAGGIAWQQSESEQRERVQAEARRVAALAESLRATDPITAMRLSVVSWELADLPESRSAVMSAAAQREQEAFTDPDAHPALVRHLSGDGRTLISVGRRACGGVGCAHPTADRIVARAGRRDRECRDDEP